ncbi:MAG: hypothetical protein AB2A00_35890 [Myxococcota bacterium]
MLNAASNRTSNYIMVLVALVGAYIGLTFIPPWMDNYQLKTYARMFGAAARFEDQEERAKAEFFRNVRSELNIRLQDNQVKLKRLNKDNVEVSVEYSRDVFWPLLDSKARTMRYKWTVVTKFKQNF